jgi:hypothetical protein
MGILKIMGLGGAPKSPNTNVFGFGKKPPSNANIFGFGKKAPSNTNVFGFGKKPPSNTNIFGFSGKNSGKNDPKVLRQSVYFKPGGDEYRAVKQRIKKIGTINAMVKDSDGKIRHEKLEEKDLHEYVKRAVGSSGMTNRAWQRHMQENKGFSSYDSKGNKKTYIISGSQLKKRKALGKIFEPDGPTPAEIAFEQKKQERFQRRNVLETQIGREREEVSYKLAERRKSGAKKSIDFRNKDNTKVNASNLGIGAVSSAVSALGGGSGAKYKFDGHGFANAKNTSESEEEEKRGTAADLTNKAQRPLG